MNIENLFVNGGCQEDVATAIDRCFRLPVEQPDWNLESSYSTVISGDPKRKVAVSPKREGWISIVESTEFVDFGMAKYLADQLSGRVVIVQVSDAIGALGSLAYEHGKVFYSSFNEEAEDPLNDARSVLRSESIPFDLMRFQEVVRMQSEGWILIQSR